MPRFNGCQDMSAIQLRERVRRRRNGARGLRQKSGTPPTIYHEVEKPAFMPIRLLPLTMFNDGLARLLGRIRRGLR